MGNRKPIIEPIAKGKKGDRQIVICPQNVRNSIDEHGLIFSECRVDGERNPHNRLRARAPFRFAPLSTSTNFDLKNYSS